jgi:hypothetical protein
MTMHKMTLVIRKLNEMPFSITIISTALSYMTQHNSQKNDTKQNDTEHKMMLSIMTLINMAKHDNNQHNKSA